MEIYAMLSFTCKTIKTRLRDDIDGYSSAGRATVSKTVGRGFDPFCPCHKRTNDNSYFRGLSFVRKHKIMVEIPMLHISYLSRVVKARL